MDAQLFHLLYGWLHQPPLDGGMRWLTHLGDSKGVMILAACGALESTLRFMRRRGGRVALASWLGIPVAMVATGWLKVLVDRPRPAEVSPALGLLVSDPGRSFPSGHATAIFALATALCLRFPKGRLVWLGVATLVALSRVGLGLHWPSDIVAGALIGAGCVMGLAWMEKRILRKKKISEDRR